MKLSKNYMQSGFTLVEIMIAVGLMGAMSLAFMKMNTQQLDSARSTKQVFERNLLMNDIRNLLADAQVCERNFGTSSGTPLNPNTPNVVTDLYDQDGKSVFDSKGSIYGDGTLSIEKMTFGANAGEIANNTPLDFQDYGSSGTFGKASLLLSIKREKSKTMAVKFFVVNITAKLNPAGTIATCTASSIAGDGLWTQNSKGIHYVDGNIGVGVADPDVAMEINISQDDMTEFKIINTNTGGSAKSRIRLKNGNPAGDNGEAGAGMDVLGHNYTVHPFLQNKFYIWSADALSGIVMSSTKIIQFSQGSANGEAGVKQTIDMVTGHVGIGVVAPLDRLHLSSGDHTNLRIDSTDASKRTEIALYSGGARQWELAQNSSWSPGAHNYTLYSDGSCGGTPPCKTINGYEVNRTTGMMSVGFTSTSLEMNNPSPADRLSAAGNISARQIDGSGNRTGSSRLMGKGGIELYGSARIDFERSTGVDFEVSLQQLAGSKGFGVWVNGSYSSRAFAIYENMDSEFKTSLSVGKNLTVLADAIITKDTSVGGNLTVTGSTSIASTLNVSGAATASSFSTPSDRSLKQDISPIESGLNKILNLQGIYYKLKSKPSEQRIGVIAQDIQKVLPEVVTTSADKKLSVRYNELTAVLIEAVKELKTQINSKDQELNLVKTELCKKDTSYSFCLR